MPLTRSDLQQIKQIVESVVDKGLDSKFKFFKQEIDESIDRKLALSEQVLDESIDDKLAALRNDFYNKVDPFLLEITEARDDRTVISEKVYRHDDQIAALQQLHVVELGLA